MSCSRTSIDFLQKTKTKESRHQQNAAILVWPGACLHVAFSCALSRFEFRVVDLLRVRQSRDLSQDPIRPTWISNLDSALACIAHDDWSKWDWLRSKCNLQDKLQQMGSVPVPFAMCALDKTGQARWRLPQRLLPRQERPTSQSRFILPGAQCRLAAFWVHCFAHAAVACLGNSR